MLNEGILQAVRNLVPVKSILKDFMNQNVSDTAEDDSDDEKETKETNESKELVVPEPVSAIQTSTLDVPLGTENKGELKEEPTAEPTAESKTEPKEELNVETKLETKEELKKPKEETKTETNTKVESPTTIDLNDKKNVSFGKYNTVFSTENPDDTDMIIDIKDEESNDGDHVPALEIMEGDGKQLTDEFDFDNLDGAVESISSGEYEEL